MKYRQYVTSRAVSEDDIDLLGHVSNIAIVRWIQEAAMAHSAARGFDVKAYANLGGIFVVRRHEIDYLRSLFRADPVEVRTNMLSADGAKCLRATEIWSGGHCAASAETTWVYLDAKTARPTRIPDVVRRAFGFPGRGFQSRPLELHPSGDARPVL
jgi:acyl-CoA thioester hydrolase